MKYIIFQAYGLKGILDELIYCIATLHRFKGTQDVTFVIYTDNKEYFESYLPVSTIYKTLNQDVLKKWKGEINFHHRVKIEMILDFVKNHDGSFLYLDTDTYFLKPIDKIWDEIAAGKMVMHIQEGILSSKKNLTLSKMSRFVSKNDFIIDRKHTKISPNTAMWNAGVLGFNSDSKHLIKKVLELTDEMYVKYQKHYIEQFAFSYFFSLENNLIPADEYIYHYWNFKEFRSVMDDFLTRMNGKSFDEIAAQTDKITPTTLMGPKLKFEKQPKLLRRFFERIVKKTWDMPVWKLD